MENVGSKTIEDLFDEVTTAEKTLAGPNGEIICWHKFTREDALLILESGNHGNRNINQLNLQKLIQEQKAGNFVQCLDPVVMTSSLNIINAQHRLAMIASTGIPETFIFVIGANEECRNGLDRGKVWSFADKEGISNQAQACTRMIAQLCLGSNNSSVVDSKLRATLIEWREPMAKVISIASKRKGTQKAYVIAAFTLASRHDPSVLAILDEVAGHQTSSEHAVVLSRFLENIPAHQGVVQRLDAALCILRLLETAVKGQTAPKLLKTTVSGLQYFYPGARYRITSSPKRPSK